MISVYLGTGMTSKIVVDVDINLKKKLWDNFKACSATKKEFAQPNGVGGWADYASPDKILDASKNVLNNGTLSFEVGMRPHKEYICCDANVLSKSSIADDLYKPYLDKGSADVAFMVKGGVFYALKAILKVRVADLFVLAEPYDAKNPIPISNVEPKIFETMPMLKHVYGKKIRASYWKKHAKQVLDASGKYGSETWNVKNIKQNFTVDNVVDELLYADGKNCPILKKAAMDFIVEHGREVIESESW
eukprot:scaffold143533_cov22-Cyclotella_meneghiniana.AAC.1